MNPGSDREAKSCTLIGDEKCNGQCLFSLRATASPASRDVQTPSIPTVRPTEVTTACYTYVPISPWQIRLLCLTSGAPDSVLHGQLQIATLALVGGKLKAILHGPVADEPVKYRALSYAWGSPARKSVINLNDRYLGITSNLDAALREIRLKDRDTYLWVDAICIDQGNLKERAEQVSNMLHIFQLASEVIVWLGLSTPGLRTTLGYLVNLTNLQRHGQTRALPSIAELRKREHKEPCRTRLFSICTSLARLYTLPWMRRVWVRQETFAAKNISVRCGSQQISWHVFTAGAPVLDWGASFGDPNVEMANELLMDLIHSTTARLTALGSRRPFRDFADVLSLCPRLEASDERDFVFAILGMCGVQGDVEERLHSTGRLNGLCADYTVSMTELWRRVTMYLFFRRHSMDNYELKNSGTVSWSVVFNFALRPCSRTTISERDTMMETYSIPQDEDFFPIQDAIPSWIMDWRACASTMDVRAIRSESPGPTAWSLFPYPLHDFDKWQFPSTPLVTPDDMLLLAPCLVWGLIGVISERTCTIEEIKSSSLGSEDAWITSSIKRDQMFDPRVHTRRVAELVKYGREGNEQKIGEVLVPNTARPGDLLVLAAPGLLPMVLASKDGDFTKPTVGSFAPETRPHKFLFRGPAIALWDNYKFWDAATTEIDVLLV